MSTREPAVQLGEQLPELRRTISRVSLFLFGVAYWSSHRIHWDSEFSREAGFRDSLVTANLLSALNAELVLAWAAPGAQLRRLEERNVDSAVAGDTLVATGHVQSIEPEGDGRLVTCALEMRTAKGSVVVRGEARVFLPG
jgi:hydroxyacyl-ACP dehydratase HTD2-like protein with hotdog domain